MVQYMSKNAFAATKGGFPMKLVCEYCDAYVDVTENNICPVCNAPLGPAVIAERNRLKKEEDERQARQAALIKSQQEAAKEQERMRMIGAIASSVASGLIGYSTGSRASRLRGPGSGILSKLGKKALSSIFK